MKRKRKKYILNWFLSRKTTYNVTFTANDSFLLCYTLCFAVVVARALHFSGCDFFFVVIRIGVNHIRKWNVFLDLLGVMVGGLLLGFDFFFYLIYYQWDVSVSCKNLGFLSCYLKKLADYIIAFLYTLTRRLLIEKT